MNFISNLKNTFSSGSFDKEKIVKECMEHITNCISHGNFEEIENILNEDFKLSIDDHDILICFLVSSLPAFVEYKNSYIKLYEDAFKKFSEALSFEDATIILFGLDPQSAKNSWKKEIFNLHS